MVFTGRLDRIDRGGWELLVMPKGHHVRAQACQGPGISHRVSREHIAFWSSSGGWGSQYEQAVAEGAQVGKGPEAQHSRGVEDRTRTHYPEKGGDKSQGPAALEGEIRAKLRRTRQGLAPSKLRSGTVGKSCRGQ